MIQLEPKGYIAKGTVRLVFQHPHAPTRLIKVLKPKKASAVKRFQGRFSPRTGQHVLFEQELSEYLVLRSKSDNVVPIVAPIHGLEETNLGLGLVVEKIADSKGEGLAPTLRELIHRRLVNESLFGKVDYLIDRLIALDVAAYDLNTQNIALRADGGGFCVIDGLGWYNAYSKARFFRPDLLSRKFRKFRIERARRQIFREMIHQQP
jgi:hypothetical protein